jgi:hypothetical protein
VGLEELKRALRELAAGEPEFLAGLVLEALRRDARLAAALAELLAGHTEARLRLASAAAGAVAIPLNVATKQDIEALRQDLERRMDGLEKRMDGLERRVEGLGERVEGLDDAVRRLSMRIDALGARWGIIAEETFKEGVRELLRDAGFVVERLAYDDREGCVYGEPATVEADVIARDGVAVLAEMTSAARRVDVFVARRKAELYQHVTGRRVDRVVIITPFVHDKDPAALRRRAEELGVRVVAPEGVG